MRGSNSLSKTFEVPTTGNLDNPVKGRSKRLVILRNQALCHRFYFYSSFTDFKYERIIEWVSRDFYLSPRTTYEILEREQSVLSNIRKEKPSILQLKRLFPLYNWTFKVISVT